MSAANKEKSDGINPSRKSLNLAVYQPLGVPQSFKVYAANILARIAPLGINASIFSDQASIPKAADVIWDIRSGGGNPPPEFLLNSALPPLVVTIHGFAPTSLPGSEYFDNWRDALLSPLYASRKRKKWPVARKHIRKVIAVSEFTKHETIAFTGIAPEKIKVCHHGVDTNIFRQGTVATVIPYFFHISNDEPRKNIHRVIEAFKKMRPGRNIELLLKVPDSSANKYLGIEGVRVISGYVNDHKLSELYCGAVGFIFPSLYEGFGMPILEAMACGCPVITSNVSACPEAAGGVALTIDPRDTNSITVALTTLIEDKITRDQLIAKGFQHAAKFTWEKSAACHANGFFSTAKF